MEGHYPSPLLGDISDNGLSTFVDVNMLNCHLLLSASPVSFVSIHL